MNAAVPRVSIGLPTYNRPELLALALECFRQQTFTDFEVIISDNASPNPEVKKLCERYAREDKRFRYVLQSANRGAEKNFWFVYDHSQAPLFMWASDDDLWPADFLEKGVAALDARQHISAWFCQVVNINVHNKVERFYPSFKRFESSAFKAIDLVRFLWEPEILGKANLIYSIFRREALAEVIEIFRERPSSWGSDMNLVYGYLCRSDLAVDDQVVLKKRVPAETVEPVFAARLHRYPPEVRAVYFENYGLAAGGSGYRPLTATILALRWAYDGCYSRVLQEYWRLKGLPFRVFKRIKLLFEQETSGRE